MDALKRVKTVLIPVHTSHPPDLSVSVFLQAPLPRRAPRPSVAPGHIITLQVYTEVQFGLIIAAVFTLSELFSPLSSLAAVDMLFGPGHVNWITNGVSMARRIDHYSSVRDLVSVVVAVSLSRH